MGLNYFGNGIVCYEKNLQPRRFMKCGFRDSEQTSQVLWFRMKLKVSSVAPLDWRRCYAL